MGLRRSCRACSASLRRASPGCTQGPVHPVVLCRAVRCVESTLCLCMTATATMSDTVAASGSPYAGAAQPDTNTKEQDVISGFREKQLIDAANMLLDARRTHTPITDLPADLQPTSLEEVACVHDFMADGYDEI